MNHTRLRGTRFPQAYVATALAAVLLLLFASCDQLGEKIGTGGKSMTARYKAAVYNEPGKTERSNWVATLALGEEVTLVEVTEFKPQKGEPQEYAHVKLAGGKEGYLPLRYLAYGALLITSDDVDLFKRPVITSGPGRGSQNVTAGAVAFLSSEESADPKWLEVSGGSTSDNTYFNGWIQSGTSGINRNPEVVAGAIQLNDISEQITSGKLKEKQKTRIKDQLERLLDLPYPVGDRARTLLDSLENPSPESAETPETPETPETTVEEESP